MKKRIAVFILVLIFGASILSGCASGQSTVSSGYNDDGIFQIEAEGRRTIMPDELPARIPYNDKYVSFDSVDLFELYSENNYNYTLFIVAAIDLTGLEDTEIHWLREEDLISRAYITCEKNEMDFVGASTLGSVLMTDGILYFVFTSSFSKSCRHSFSESEVSVSVEIKQEDTYEYKGSDGKTTDLHKSEVATYRMTAPTTITDANNMHTSLLDYVVKWLDNRATALK